jgi:hypothetical protein
MMQALHADALLHFGLQSRKHCEESYKTGVQAQQFS